jgi:hypothetical protein
MTPHRLRAIRSAALLAPALLAAACATFAPRTRGVYVADDAEPAAAAEADAPAVVLVGDIGLSRGEDSERLARSIGAAAAGATPVLVLGDVFYVTGLLGACADKDPPYSIWGCDDPGPPEAQLDSVLGPYREHLGDSPLVAIGGNHDHYGGEDATRNACRLIPEQKRGWRYLARGCGLDEARPVESLDLGPLVILTLDSEPMIHDAEYRRRSLEALRRTLRFYRTQKPEVWRVVATHHPIESHGSHNGAGRVTAVMKDLYSLRLLLYPLFYPLERLIGQQDVYELRYRAYRRDFYRLLRDEPVDVFVSGHDHSLQHVRIQHPGVQHQLVSGAGAHRSAVKRFGLDLLWSNRLARLLGLGDSLPAPRHDMAFGTGGEYAEPDLSGYGFAVLSTTPEGLRVEFRDPARSQALYATTLRRTPAP